MEELPLMYLFLCVCQWLQESRLQFMSKMSRMPSPAAFLRALDSLWGCFAPALLVSGALWKTGIYLQLFSPSSEKRFQTPTQLQLHGWKLVSRQKYPFLLKTKTYLLYRNNTFRSGNSEWQLLLGFLSTCSLTVRERKMLGSGKLMRREKWLLERY